MERERTNLWAPSETWILIPDCEHRRLYRVEARNIAMGVWDKEQRGFYGIRMKFERRFIDVEHHWDEEKFATAKPVEALEMMPDDMELSYGSEALFAWLDQKLAAYAATSR